MQIPSPSNVDLGGEQWVVRYFPRVIKSGKYIAAARVPSKKEIWLSLQDERGTVLSAEAVAEIFSKAAVPIVEKNIKNRKDVQ